jgi:cytochrome c oxidase subunit II
MKYLLALLAFTSFVFAEEVLAYPKVYWENSVKVWF